jgi:hypothetical protein
MTTFEILNIILSVLLMLGAIIGVYIKSAIAIAKIQVEIVEIKRDLVTKEIAILNIEKNNRDDFKENRDNHKEIISKIDRLVETIIKD